MKHIHISVPGSMMIFGEYFITAPNNSALCLAINKRATLDIRYTSSDIIGIAQERPKVELETRYEGKILRWDSPEDCDMYSIAQDICNDFFPEASPPNTSLKTSLNTNQKTSPKNGTTQREKISVVIDTNAFFNANPCIQAPAIASIRAVGEYDTVGAHAIASDAKNQAPAIASIRAVGEYDTVGAHAIASDAKNQKLGLGSSEASALLFCVLILILKNIDIQTYKNTLAEFATKVHYIWQGNRGSGYGIYTSLYGNMGIFHKIQKYNKENNQEYNTMINVWTSLNPPVDIHWYYCILRHSVSTKKSLQAFEIWKTNNTDLYQTMEEQARNAMKDLSSITTEKASKLAFVDWVRTVAMIGRTLGDYIGVSAMLDETNLPNDRDIVWKATGAGNENAIGISQKDTAQKNTAHKDTAHKDTAQNNNAISIEMGTGLMIETIEETA